MVELPHARTLTRTQHTGRTFIWRLNIRESTRDHAFKHLSHQDSKDNNLQVARTQKAEHSFCHCENMAGTDYI